MATSLAAQLRQLEAPQTSQLHDRKSRASILFDLREAANKDRRTIYDLGLSGLTELSKLNPLFLQFDQTLFNSATIDVERSVESNEMNDLINKSIKKFFYHLSPYFMLQPAHMCLEWLIRRFHINEFNVNELMALILPYHETNIFVRCIQIIRFRADKVKWYWIVPLKKPGIPLSKQVLFNHASRNPHFLIFVCKATREAVKELDRYGNRGHTLQVQINFYCTTVIGALEYSKTISEDQLTSILETILKGLDSNVLDFTAASLMIVAQLLIKSKLNIDLLNALIDKMCKIQHAKVHTDLIFLLILMYKTQNENLKDFPSKTLEKFISNKSLNLALQICSEKTEISSLCVPLIQSALRRVQAKEDNWQICKVFLDNLLADIHFMEEDAKNVIRCVLDNYYKKEKPAFVENEIIEIDESDDDEIHVEEDVQKWYSEYLQRLERQYPNEFDFTIKETMQGLENISEARKLALKTVLAFRLKSSYSEDNSTIYENLYHHDAKYRQEAVKYLTKNFAQLTVTDQGKLMVKDSLFDRLNDDNAKVLHETFKLNTENFVQLLGAERFSEKLIEILTKSHIYEQKEWSKVISAGFKHLIKPSVINIQKEKTILAFIPFLLPTGTLHITDILTKDELSSIPFLKSSLAPTAKTDKIEDYERILRASLNLPTKFEDILLVFDNSKLFNVGYILMLLSVSLKNSSKKLSSEFGLKVIELLKIFKKKSLDIESNYYIEVIKQNKIPHDFYLDFIIEISKCIQIESKIDVNQNTPGQIFVNKIYEELTTKSFTIQKQSLKQKYTDKLKIFLNIFCPESSDKLKFLSNFFMIKNLQKEAFEDLSSLQIRSLRLFNLVIIGKQEYILDKFVFYKILLGLCSTVKYIRELSLEALRNLCGQSDRISDYFKIFIQKVLEREDEIKMDAEQFPLIICIIISSNRVSKKSETKLEINAADKILTDLFDCVENMEGHLKIETLKMLKHINTPSILERLLKSVLKIFDNSSKEILDEVDGKMYSLILQRFDENTTGALLKKSKEGWEFINKSLKQYNTFIRVNDKVQSLATVLLNGFDEDIYETIPQKLKPEFIQLIVIACTYSVDVTIHKVAVKLIKRIPMHANLIEKIIKEMISSEKIGENKSKKNYETPSPDNLNSVTWKCGVTLLEFLQNKAQITNVKSLIGYLFDVLKMCLDFADQTAIEYTKQLVLSCILNFCQMGNKFTISEKVFRIDLIVECIRCTHNPQTHHHALVLLSHCASWIPQQVLDNMVHIFTFMGSSVVRHDDVFSLQLISNVIESIIPALLRAGDGKNEKERQEMVLPVLKVFSDILLDVPEHRRMSLYSKLIKTLGAEDHFWLFLSVVFENQVIVEEKETNKTKLREDPRKTTSELPKRLSIALQLIKEFDPPIILETCIKLLIYLRTLPMEKDEKMDIDEIINVDKTIFAIETHTPKQLRHFKYVVLQFISLVTSSTEFVNSIALLDPAESKLLKSYYKNIIIQILTYIPKVTEAIEKIKGTRLKYWEVLLSHCYNVLDNVISLLSADLFLVVVHGLMKHQLAAVRKKVLDLLISKLQYNKDFFENCNEENLLNILDPLNDILNSILTGEKLMENASVNEAHMIQQLTLIAIKLLSRVLASKHISVFKDILNKLTEIISKKSNEISKIILAAVVLAITEVSSNLRAHSISVLPKFMPHLLQVLKYQEDELKNHSPDNCTMAIVTSFQKIFESLPLFLGPYIEDIFTSLITIWVHCTKYQDKDQRANMIITKLQQIWTKISTTIPLRILIPNCSKTYDRLIDQKQYSGLKYLMKILTERFDNIAGQEIVAQQNEITAFFLKSLEFRSNLSNYNNLEEINSIEEDLLQAFVTLILKLSESSFRPLYNKVYDWAIRTNDTKDRRITYFLLSRKLSDSLKSLFVLFASNFIQDAADLLNEANTSKANENKLYFEENDKNLILIDNILNTLRNIFLNDSKGFINAHRFDILMQPIVDQLDNSLIHENERLQTILGDCISHLAVASSNDSLWKQLNYQVLLKTRTNNFQIRILSFNCCVEIARKLGDDFSSLLPETIPFVAELLEDENQKVEKNTRKGVQDIEKLLGESLQNYF